MRSFGLWVCLLCAGCATSAPARRTAPASAPAPAPAEGSTLRLVETSPVETTLQHPDIPDAHEVWPALIGSAQKTLELAEFYLSNAPNSRLEPVVAAVEAAADRGVAVRVLAEEKFYRTYPDTLDRLARRPGIQVRRFDVAKRMGGILHAKYFIVDGATAYLGSQNFDWRALEHIQELGVELRESASVTALRDVFETDWLLAGGASNDTRIRSPGSEVPAAVLAEGGPARVTPVFSPKGFLPDERLWDLPRLVELINSARKTVRVQVLNYKASQRFDELQGALVRAGRRGVQVELLVSEWATRGTGVAGLAALGRTPNVSVRVLTVPRWSGGEIPFARVIHAKYLAVDGERAWVGTSNWERDYFFESRNVGVIVEGAAFTERLERFFDDDWESEYVSALQ